MTIKLYCFGESGNSYKAALALELSGLAWEPVFVDFFAGETRNTAPMLTRWVRRLCWWTAISGPRNQARSRLM
jgi:hypothetical protein